MGIDVKLISRSEWSLFHIFIRMVGLQGNYRSRISQISRDINGANLTYKLNQLHIRNAGQDDLWVHIHQPFLNSRPNLNSK